MKPHLLTLSLFLIYGPTAASEDSPFSPLFVPEVGQITTGTTLVFNSGRNTITLSGGTASRFTDNPRYLGFTQSVIVGLPWDGFSVGAAASYSESLKSDTDRVRYMEGFLNPSFLFQKTLRLDNSDLIHITYSTSPKTGNEGIRTGEVTEGRLPNKAATIVKEWCEHHRSELLENWTRAQHFEPLERIQGADQDD